MKRNFLPKFVLPFKGKSTCRVILTNVSKQNVSITHFYVSTGTLYYELPISLSEIR